jgi:hypothetical protein
MPTAPGFAEISMRFGRGDLSRPAYITFGIDPTATDPSAIASSVALAFNTAGSLKDMIDGNVTMTGVRVSLGTDGTEDLVYQSTTTIGCTRSMSSVPPNVALLVHKNTGRGGRRGRGRMFIPWALAGSDAQENGQVNNLLMSTFQGQCNTFLTQLGVQGVPMVVLHGPGLTAPGAPNTVLTLTVDPLVSTQRRRLGR